MLDGLLKRLTVVCSAIIYYIMLSHVHVQLKDLPVAFYTLKELSEDRCSSQVRSQDFLKGVPAPALIMSY